MLSSFQPAGAPAPYSIQPDAAVPSRISVVFADGWSADSVQWQRAPLAGGAAVDIAGATSWTYDRTVDDRNTRHIPKVSGLRYTPAGLAYPLGKPAAPSISSVIAGDGSITVFAVASADNGGSAVTGYRAYVYRASDGALLTTADSISAQIAVGGLANGILVFARVSAINGVGESDISAKSDSVTPAKPVAPGRSVNSFVINSVPL